MLNKVEISNVNTANLRALSGEENKKLLREMKNGDKTAREKLINGNLRLVLSVIQRFSGRGENPDDLFQIGCIGLIKSIDNFDISLDIQLSTYAVPMIIGEIRRYLRDSTPVRISRSIKDTAYRVMQAKEKYIAENGREPTAEEIAAVLGIEKADVVMALGSVVDPLSLYEPVFSEGGDTIYVLDQVGDNNDDKNWLDEISMKEAIRDLSERERRILKMRFIDGKTQMEVSSEIGISQAQVSRLEKFSLQKIKDS